MRNDEKEFDSDQQHEIEEGLKAGVDVSCYARKEFMAIQMRQIRLGLEAGLDVSVYARTEFDWFQMEEIRLGMQSGVPYASYAKPSISYERMREIRKGMLDGIDLSGYAQLNAGILKELRKAIVAKVSIIEFINEGYVEEQLEEIRAALEKKLPIKQYLSTEFRGIAIREIRQGLEDGIDPSVYASTEYDGRQMREIRLGLEHRVDVSQYQNSLFSWQQMHEIRLGLEEGLDVTPYRTFMYVAADMKRIREKLSAGVMDDVLDQVLEKPAEAVTASHRIAVFISGDEMEVCTEIRCGQKEDVTAEEVLLALKANGVTQGILKAEIEQAVKEKKFNQTIVVAKGKPPMQGRDGRYEFLFNTQVERTPEVMLDGSVDYTNTKWFEYVEEGQTIAVYHPAGFGTGGYTVTGKFLASKKGKEKSILVGKGFKKLDDGVTYVAALTGRIELVSENRIEISRMLELDEVTLATGNVEFDGSVVVHGDVGSGVKIHATEDIVVNGFSEAAEIKGGGEIFFRHGVRGTGDGVIEAGKSVVANFFEFTKITAGENIEANYCLNCDMTAGEWIKIQGTKGTIAGGTARAAKGIKTCNVGNVAKLPTVLKLGLTENAIQQKRELELKIKEIGNELVILGNAYMDFQKKYVPEVRNTMDTYIKIENAIYTKELEQDSLNKKLQALEQAASDTTEVKAVIYGVLYEGCVICIDNLKKPVYGVKDVTVRRVKDRIVLQPN